jgi:hypothetical protein
MIELYRLRLFVGRLYSTEVISQVGYDALLDKIDEEEEKASLKR